MTEYLRTRLPNDVLPPSRHLRQLGAGRIVVAATGDRSRSTFYLIHNAADEVAAVIAPEEFYGVGQWYEDFILRLPMRNMHASFWRKQIITIAPSLPKQKRHWQELRSCSQDSRSVSVMRR